MLEASTNFFRYFFGPGTEGYKFKYFSPAHLLPIILMIIVIFLIYKYRNQIRDNHELDKSFRIWISFTLSFVNISWYWLYIYIGTDVKEALPISVCETVMFLSPFLLLSKSQKLFDVLYFWTICGSTNALITPAILDNFGPTKYRYYQFWIGHTGIFIVIFYCLFVLQMKINFKSLLRSLVAILLFGFLAIYVNAAIPGANYLFLSGSEAGSSILDILPSYLPLRFIIMLAIVIFLFSLALLPWMLINHQEELKQINQNDTLIA